MKIRLLLVSVQFIVLIACKSNAQKDKHSDVHTTNDTINHGYNELANVEKRKAIAISDYNTDNSSIQTISRPVKSIINSDIDTSLLFRIWTSDPDGPHADFDFSRESFFVVDYDGDGAMPYILNNRNLKVYYNDFIQEGDIDSVSKDTLKIKWKDIEEVTTYTLWKN